ncbi:MAG: hypothetical protein Q8P40_13150 [Nitrospirota bacterium]|nr:hypothetical protein [Nitrospirota bacterium]
MIFKLIDCEINENIGKFMSMCTQPTREEMISYLRDHFRYDTMSSWNRSMSYARNVKIYGLGLTHEQEMKAFEFIETPGALEDINLILQDFNENHDEWQVGFNGRSGGLYCHV